MVRLGFIGTGRMGRVHIKNITTSIEEAFIKSAADPYMDVNTEKWLKSLGINEVYKDYTNILKDPEIDAVIISSTRLMRLFQQHTMENIHFVKTIDRDMKNTIGYRTA